MNYIPMQDLQGIQPVFQNASAQQQSQQGLMKQGNQFASQALLPADQQYSPKQMAGALRSLGETINAYAPWTQAEMSNQYGTDPYSEQSRMLAMQERGM